MKHGERGRLGAGILLAAGGLLLSWERLRPVTSPLLTGLCLAVFLDPLCGLLENRVLRPLCRSPFWKGQVRRLSVALALLLAAGGGGLLVGQAAQSLGQAMDQLPALGGSLERQAQALSQELTRYTGGRFRLDLAALSRELLANLLPSLGALGPRLAGWGASLFLGTVFALWMLLKKEAAFSLCRRLLGLFPTLGPQLREMGRLCRRSFSAFVRGQLTEAVILGSGCLIGMLLFQKPFAGLISLIIGITALVPVAGALVGGAFGTALLLGQSLGDGIWFLIFIVLLQQLENNLIYPRVMGRSVGLPAALVLLAVLLGGTLLGIPGMLLLVPVASALWVWMGQLLEKPPARP